MSYKLFLDDRRNPREAFFVWNPVQYACNPAYLTPDWVIVKSYDEFVDYITKNGMPELISFDHDLADEHFFGKPTFDPIPYDIFKEKTGRECAEWLCYYILDNEYTKFPPYLVHSQNPCGSENIVSVIETFKKVWNFVDEEEN